jgi:hypothetical protein
MASLCDLEEVEDADGHAGHASAGPEAGWLRGIGRCALVDVDVDVDEGGEVAVATRQQLAALLNTGRGDELREQMLRDEDLADSNPGVLV